MVCGSSDASISIYFEHMQMHVLRLRQCLASDSFGTVEVV